MTITQQRKVNNSKLTKITKFNFLPLSLMKQFGKIYNLFYLVIVILNATLLKLNAPYRLYSCFVISIIVQIIKDYVYDFSLMKLENKLNKQPAKLYNFGQFGFDITT